MKEPTTTEDTPAWELVVQQQGTSYEDRTERLRIVGGTLYRTILRQASKPDCVAVVFVPR
jgi:hypothetical protein